MKSKIFLQFFNAMKKLKLATVVKGYPKAPFSIGAPPSFRKGRNTFPWIASILPLKRNLIMLSKEVSSTTFWVFGMTRPEIEPKSSRPFHM